MEEEYEITKETTEKAATESGEEESAETTEETVEYQLDEEGEQILDDDGNPIPIEKEEPEEEKPNHKKNAQDRIQQLANEKRELAERLAKLEQQFAETEQEKPDYYDVDMDKVNAYIQETSDKIEELKLEGNFLAAKKLELAQVKLITNLEENDKKRQAYIERQGKSKTDTDLQKKSLDELDRAAEFYRESQKITPEVWQKMGEWFTEECRKDPLLGREFSERVETQSRVAAIKWAHDYAVKNMSSKAKASIDAKNKAKETASGAAPKVSTAKVSGGKEAIAKALEVAKDTGDWSGWFEARRAAGVR